MCDFTKPNGQRMCEVGKAIRERYDAAMNRAMGTLHREDRRLAFKRADAIREELHQHIQATKGGAK